MDKRERNNFINQRVQEHYNEACSLGCEVFGVFLQGSQNYNLDIYSDSYKSDIDTKAIILPSFDDFCNGALPVSTTHVRDNNEHIDIKDIRKMFETFHKQNINFMEILFTKYFVVADKYMKFWKELCRLGEDLTHCHPAQTLRTMAGMSCEKRKAMCHPYPATVDKIEKYGYDGKQLHHILRVNDFMKKYIAGVPFSKCLTERDDETTIHLTEAKLNIYNIETALSLADEVDAENKKLKDDFISANGDVCNSEVYAKLDALKVSILRYWFKEQLGV